MTSDADGGTGANAARFFLPNCETLRIGAKHSMNKLAALADIDRSRITMIEKNHPVSQITAQKVFDALNELHGGRLEREKEIVTKPR